jgi:hypothetical protein
MMDDMVRLPDDIDVDPRSPPERDFPLNPPVEFNKKVFRSIRLREPSGAVYEAAQREMPVNAQPTPIHAVRFQMTMLAGVARVPREVIERMRLTEIQEAFAFVLPLFQAFLATGETSSLTSPDSGDGDLTTDGR